MQAIVLAAGMGKRLHSNENKCLTRINGLTLWERMVLAFRKAQIEKIIVVTGYRAKGLEKYIMAHSEGLEIHFIENSEYETTNNIWSLYLAGEYFDEDTILLESDLIFEYNVVEEICKSKFPNIALLAEMESWMNGTRMKLYGNDIIEVVSSKDIFNTSDALYKTVNIYKFSNAFLKDVYLPEIEKYISLYGKQEYYEMVLGNVIKSQCGLIKGMVIRSQWYEIDTIEDLEEAKKRF